MPSQFAHLKSCSIEKGKKRLQRFNSATKRAKLFTEKQVDVSAEVKGDLDISGIVELDNTTDARMNLPQPDFAAHSHAAPSSPLPDATPLLASTPLSGLRKPLESSERKMLYDEIGNLRRDKEDLTAELVNWY